MLGKFWSCYIINNINVNFETLIDELNQYSEEGVVIFDAFNQKTTIMHAFVLLKLVIFLHMKTFLNSQEESVCMPVLFMVSNIMVLATSINKKLLLL